MGGDIPHKLHVYVVSSPMLRSVTLTPNQINSSKAFTKIQRLQPIFNRLYDLISRDDEWLKKTFSVLTEQCAWSR